MQLHMSYGLTRVNKKIVILNNESCEKRIVLLIIITFKFSTTPVNKETRFKSGV